MELCKRLQCKVANCQFFFRKLLEVNEHRRKSTISSKNVSNVQYVDEQNDRLTFLPAMAHLSWF